MSTFTENYNLIKPSTEDLYDIQDFNENMDTLDALLAENETAAERIQTTAEQINEKIGTPEDTAANTLFGSINEGKKSLIKSLQRIQVAVYSYSGSATKEIQPVDSSRSFVYFTRLQDQDTTRMSINYTLTDTALSVTTGNIASGNYQLILDFWIIEFR